MRLDSENQRAKILECIHARIIDVGRVRSLDDDARDELCRLDALRHEVINAETRLRPYVDPRGTT